MGNQATTNHAHAANREKSVRAVRFFGREGELAKLEQWILGDRCRLVFIVGIGGIGKTALTLRLTEKLQDAFDGVVWRDLRNAPPIDEIVAELIQELSTGQEVSLPERLDRRIDTLMDLLDARRCLLILDNAETILQKGESTTLNREEADEYSHLIRQIGNTPHQSCMIVTSREKPRETRDIEHPMATVRSLRLRGLARSAGQEMFADCGLIGSEQHWDALVDRYAGNPRALQLVVPVIQDLFRRDIAAFLDSATVVIGGIRELLDQQFAQMGDVERGVVYWLAIEREPMSLGGLFADYASTLSWTRFLEAVEALHRRSMVEIVEGTGQLAIHPTTMEYVTERIIEISHDEISSGQVSFLNEHALAKAQAVDHIRASQVRLIIQPLVDRLLATMGRSALESRLGMILSGLQRESHPQPGYCGGNIVNILTCLGSGLTGRDLSRLVIRQADLRDVELPGVSFAHSDLTGSVFTEAFGSVASIAFNPAGDLLAAGTSNHEVRVWRVSDGTQVSVLKGHTDIVRSVTFSPDGALLASGSHDGTARLWDIARSGTARTFRHQSRVRAVAFSPNGGILACGCEDHTVQLWETRTGRCLYTLRGHKERVWSIAFHPQEGVLASASSDGTVQLWDATTGQLFRTLPSPGRVRTIAFTPDGRILASGGDELTLWDYRTASCLMKLPWGAGEVRAIAFDPSGRILASGSEGQALQLWDVSTGERLQSLYGHTSWIGAVAFSPNGQVLVSSGEDQTLRFWDTESWRCCRLVQGYKNWVLSVTSSPASGHLIASGSSDGTVRLWEIDTGTCVKTLPTRAQNHIRAIAFSPDGRHLASGSDDHVVRFWDISSGRCLLMEGHTGRIKSVAFSPDGTTIASAGEDRTIRLWDTKTAQCRVVLTGHTDRVESIAFSPDGRRLVSGAEDSTVRLWDAQTGQPLKTLLGHTNWVWSVAYSPDGRKTASGGDDQTILIWSVATGQVVRALHHTDRIWSVAFSRNGRILASGSDDSTVQLWDLQTGERKILRGHTDSVMSVAFASDGLVVITGSDDETIRLWDVQRVESLRVLQVPKPYEGMDITGVSGLTEAQQDSLRALGASEVGAAEPPKDTTPGSTARDARTELPQPPARGLYHDRASDRILLDGRDLTAEFRGLQRKLVRLLCSKAGAVCTYEDIARKVYGARRSVVSDASIQQLVKRVRMRIEPDWKNPSYIVTIPGVGYQLRLIK